MTHGHDGLIVAPGNTIEFAAAVDRLMSDDRLRHTLGEAASESVRRFASEAVLQRRESQFALLQR
jgi:glycosyltransferase involved in cell wall biosynthesis